jgi:glycosyltransferase involved in cell wall biosynthesis
VAEAGGRVRVLRVIARLNVGGPALQATVLSNGLDPARFEQRLLAGAVGPGEGDFVELRAPDLPVETVPGLGRAPKAGADAQALVQLRRAIRRFRPHIVHTHTFKAGLLGRLAAWSCGVPATVHTFHGHLLHSYFSAATTKALVTSERLLARRTTRLVAVGAQVRDELLAAGIGRPEQFSVVPPGVFTRTAPSREAARAELGLASDGAVVAFVARLTGVKRPQRFVDLARALAPSHPDATFVVVGEGELLEQLRESGQGLGPALRFLGWRPDVETVYAASDVVVLTSDNEGMPVSLIEAALHGRPAVTTRVGSAAEVVVDGETGFVTSTSMGDLTAATERLLSDPELRRRMGAAAAARATHQFGPARLTADIERLYDSITADWTAVA